MNGRKGISSMTSTEGSRWKLALAAGLGSVALVASACSSATSTTPSASTSASASASTATSQSEAATPSASAGPKIVITTTSNFGGLEEITIKAGEPLTVSNGSAVPHTFTEGQNGQPVANPVVNEIIQPGDQVDVTFPDKGDFHVTCRFHAAMNLVVHVE
jgi:plastocyanin